MNESSAVTRFAVIGGYLGAGKTTLTVALAKHLRDLDKNVALITNDQGHALVDTEYARGSGVDVREVMGCFCSTFPEFLKSARSLVQISRPDVILAEPIGTSTNILSSVVDPLRYQYPEEFSVAPFMVVVDGTRASQLSGDKLIPAHQVREAEIILLSKIDLLDEDALDRAKGAVAEVAPNTTVIPYSVRTNVGIDSIVDILISSQLSRKEMEGEDYRIFINEKESMSWFSSTATIIPDDRVDAYGLTTTLLRGVADTFPSAEVAHVKVTVISEQAGAKMSLVGDSAQVDGLRGGRYFSDPARLIINARVTAESKELGDAMRSIMTMLKDKFPIDLDNLTESCYSPKPSAPTFFTGQ
ncbi:MAG: GTP-binding protein [Euryarchaeota archaeon]|nr:GTP-binding protein [Euryarchaeota archaeon]